MTHARRRFYQAWWSVWGAMLVVLAASARPRILWTESRPIWAAICLCAAVAAFVALVRPRADGPATAIGVAFALARAGGFCVGVDLLFEQRVTGVVTWVTFATAVWCIGTGAMVFGVRNGLR